MVNNVCIPETLFLRMLRLCLSRPHRPPLSLFSFLNVILLLVSLFFRNIAA